MSEPTLTDITQQLETMEKRINQHLEAIEKRLDTLDGRLFDFTTMRVVSVNQSAFYSVGLALLSAAIAFVVARVSGGRGL